MNTTITRIPLSTGDVLELQQRSHGRVWLLNGVLWCSPDMLLTYLIDYAIETDNLDALRELCAIVPEDGTCSCGRSLSRSRCDDCGVLVACEWCLHRHRRRGLCALLREHVNRSRAMGRHEATARASAIRAYLPNLKQMGLQ